MVSTWRQEVEIMFVTDRCRANMSDNIQLSATQLLLYIDHMSKPLRVLDVASGCPSNNLIYDIALSTYFRKNRIPCSKASLNAEE